MILLKIWSIPLTWDSSFSSMPIIERLGIFLCFPTLPVSSFSVFYFTLHRFCTYFWILVFCLLLESFFLAGFPLSFLVELLGFPNLSSFQLESSSVFYFLTDLCCPSLALSCHFHHILCFMFSWLLLRHLFSWSFLSLSLLICFFAIYINSLNFLMKLMIFLNPLSWGSSL